MFLKDIGTRTIPLYRDVIGRLAPKSRLRWVVASAKELIHCLYPLLAGPKRRYKVDKTINGLKPGKEANDP
jgi:hypothetical protein